MNFIAGKSHWPYAAYQLGVSDRNDYAIMLARTILADVGCKATRERAMPALAKDLAHRNC